MSTNRRKLTARVPNPQLDRRAFPDYDTFHDCCARGLSTVDPFKLAELPDPFGWKFSSGWPPSYSAFGRMRSLLAVHDSLRLKPKRVLEVAAGGGGLAATLAAAGSEVSVNDLRGEFLVEAVAEYSTGNRIRIFGCNLFDLSPVETGKFDLVVACEVIEHVAHPADLLKHLKSFLEPGGRLLLTTPNGSYFRNKLPTFAGVKDFAELEAKQFKPDADGHLFLFTPRELSEVAASVGLAVEHLSVWGTPMLTGHALFRLLAGLPLAKAVYRAENLAQRLPFSGREYFCFAMSAILRSDA